MLIDDLDRLPLAERCTGDVRLAHCGQHRTHSVDVDTLPRRENHQLARTRTSGAAGDRCIDDARTRNAQPFTLLAHAVGSHGRHYDPAFGGGPRASNGIVDNLAQLIRRRDHHHDHIGRGQVGNAAHRPDPLRLCVRARRRHHIHPDHRMTRLPDLHCHWQPNGADSDEVDIHVRLLIRASLMLSTIGDAVSTRRIARLPQQSWRRAPKFAKRRIRHARHVRCAGCMDRSAITASCYGLGPFASIRS